MKILTTLILSGLLLSACGTRSNKRVKNAQKQPNGELETPTDLGGFDDSFGLNQKGSLVFDMSLIVWDQPSPKQVQDIGHYSVESRLLKSEFLDLMGQQFLTLAEQNAQLNLALDENAQQINAATQNLPEVENKIRPLISGWVAQRLKEVQQEQVGLFSQADVDHAENFFEAFCEYKIWDLATSNLIHLNFMRRPTPLQMCETVYANSNLGLFTGEECADSSSEAGKNYFDCIWKQGVLKTKTFAALKSASIECRKDREKYGTRDEAIERWVNNGRMQEMLSDFEITRQVTRVRDHIIASAGSIVPSHVRKKYTDFNECPKAFKRSELVALGSEMDWDFAELKRFRTIDMPEPEKFPFQFFPAAVGDGVNLRRWEMFARPIRYFSERRRLEGEDEDLSAMGLEISFDDYLFNQPVGVQLQKHEQSEQGVKTDPAWQSFIAQLRQYAPKDLLDKEKSLQTDLEKNELALAGVKGDVNQSTEDCLVEKTQSLACYETRIRTSQTNGVASVLAVEADKDGKGLRKATKLFMGAKLDLQVDSEFVILRLAVGNGRYSGCFALTGKNSCPKLEGRRLEVSSFGENEPLVFAIDVKDAAAEGFGMLKRGENGFQFNEISEKHLSGSKLAFRVFGNQLGQYMSFFTGEFQVIKNGEVLFTGSTSGDNQTQVYQSIAQSMQ